MCSGTVCTGTALAGASCAPFSEQLVNFHCVDNGTSVFCAGDPAPEGSPCQRGCGTLQPLEPGLPILLCVAAAETLGEPCPNMPPCTTGVCAQIGNEVRCALSVVECPNDDGGPCTFASCDSSTGTCQTHFACHPECETCNQSTGMCEPVNDGIACDDGKLCTPESRCKAIEIPGLGLLGICVTPAPTSTATATATETRTSTPTPIVPTATATPIVPTATLGPCRGDCDHDDAVDDTDLVTGVEIALGRTALASCESLDADDDQRVDVSEIIRAVVDRGPCCSAQPASCP